MTSPQTDPQGDVQDDQATPDGVTPTPDPWDE
jgi:hypothetical protein